MSQERSPRSSLWVPQAPAIHLVRTLEADLATPAAGLSGHFTVEVVHGPTGDVRRRLEFPNLITNAGLNALGGNPIASLVNYLAVGDGQREEFAVPSVNDQSLDHELVRTATPAGDGAGVAPGAAYHWYRRTREFAQGVAEGNLTELGFFSTGPTGGVLWNRQRFKDANGQNTVVSVTSFDKLRVTYEWRIYPPANPAGNVTSEVTISGVTHQVVTATRMAGYEYSWGTGGGAPGLLTGLGAFTNRGGYWESNQVPTYLGTSPGAADWGGTVTFDAYQSGNYYREGELVLNPDTGNFNTGIGGIGSLKTNDYAGYNSCGFVHCFTPKIAKTDTKRLAVRLRLGWGRYGE